MMKEKLLRNHNTYYHPLILRQLPEQCQNALDVGCGKGLFAVKLAARAEHVDAVDRSAEMIEVARKRAPDNVSCLLADVMTTDLPTDHYDMITSISALHHLPLEPALERLRDALRPGGRPVAIALPRTDLPRELPLECVAAVSQRTVALALFGIRSATGNWGLLGKDPEEGKMPVVLDTELSVREVRQRAATVLPGARVSRLLFWRYLLVWQKPLT